MRILVHDYAGHPFQVQLSRALARRGHAVAHAWCPSLGASPYAAFDRRAEDPASLEFRPLALPGTIDKTRLWARYRADKAYAALLRAEVARFAPDAVISGNTPLDAQAALLRATRRRGARFVFWLQDFISEGATRVLRRKSPVASAVVGGHYRRVERSLLRRSDDVVVITDAFRVPLLAWGVEQDRLHTIENWAPLDELPPREKESAWSRAHGLHDKLVLLYSGTLGMKHNPELLLRLARRFGARDDLRVVVISRGHAASWLAQRRDELGLRDLVLLDFQPFEAMPDVLASADVLLAILEPDAGTFSVPSKVLTYLCAGRALLLAVPAQNLAAETVRRARAGVVVDPTDAAGFVREAEKLVDDADARAEMGAAGRVYAERTFDIERITDRFEAILRPS